MKKPNYPTSCEDGFNLRKIEEGMYMECIHAPFRAEVKRNIVEVLRGVPSSGICSVHESYARWYANQPPTEEEMADREEFEERVEEAKRKAGLL